MKSFLLTLSLVFASQSFATSDAHDKAYIVVRDIQSAEFFVERAPIIGCYGLAYGPRLIQFTMEYKVTSNIGCGDLPVFHDNINYLTCAKVVSTKESQDYTSLTEITLDISKCDAKDDSKFITAVRTAAKLNFPLKRGEVKLTFVK